MTDGSDTSDAFFQNFPGLLSPGDFLENPSDPSDVSGILKTKGRDCGYFSVADGFRREMGLQTGHFFKHNPSAVEKRAMASRSQSKDVHRGKNHAPGRSVTRVVGPSLGTEAA